MIIPADEGTNLSSSLNAGDATFDLSDGRWGDVSLSGNAVAIHVDLSGAQADGFDRFHECRGHDHPAGRGQRAGWGSA